MHAEVEHWILKRTRDDVLVETEVVQPGNIVPVDFFGKIKILVGCGIDGNTSGIVVKSDKNKRLKGLSAFVYRDEDDTEGTSVDPVDGIISIVKPQELELVLSEGWLRRKPKRQILITFPSGGEDIPQELPQGRVPVLV